MYDIHLKQEFLQMSLIIFIYNILIRHFSSASGDYGKLISWSLYSKKKTAIKKQFIQKTQLNKKKWLDKNCRLARLKKKTNKPQ